MRRVIIAAIGVSYPRGGAKANYLQYVADALIAEGYQVELLVSTNREYTGDREFTYHHAHVREIMAETGNHLLDRLLNGKLFWHRVSKLLETYQLTAEDVIMAETNLDRIVEKLKPRYGFKTIGYPLEWYGREQYPDDHTARLGEAAFRAYGRKDLIFPISHHIARQFAQDPCQSLILPIMADTRETPYQPKQLENRYHFIFPANGRMKDSLEEILKGAAALSAAYRSRMCFHLTGVKEETVRELLTPRELENLRDVLVIHKWMEYAELVELYQKAHFLFFSRPVTQTTLSNFPSKVPEALTYGVVPVVSRVGDYTQYYLTDQVDSLIFDGDDREVCRQALERALDLPWKTYEAMSRNARQTAETRFDYRNWQKQIRDSIEKLFS